MKKSTKKAGRPKIPKSERRDHGVSIRLTLAEYAKWERERQRRGVRSLGELGRAIFAEVC